MQWALNTIESSADLSTVFGCVWRFSTMSQHQREEMATVQKFKRGIISVPIMEYEMARTIILFRPELAPERKLLTHERAMSMGADDPTKPDYSKYMPKEKDAIFDSKMRPLKHNL